MSMTAPPGGSGRRRFLLAGLSLTLTGLAAACDLTDPTITRPPTPSVKPSPSPSPNPPLPGARTASTTELRLAWFADAILGDPAKDLSATTRTVLANIRDAHRVHAAALSGADPTTLPTATSTLPPSPSPTSPRPPKRTSSALNALAKQEKTAAADYQTYGSAATGTPALLWASLQAATMQYAVVAKAKQAPAAAATPNPHPPFAVVDDTTALQDLLTQVHAIIYGYQLALAQLPSGDQRDAVAARLTAHRVLRNELTALLVAAGADVPQAEPAYRPPFEPSSTARAIRLLQSLEGALLPYCGQWLAAADADQRDLARSTLLATTAASTAWGGPVLVWPGWPT